MKLLKIVSKKHGTFDVKIDDEDYDLMIQYRWYIVKEPTNVYAKRKVGHGRKNRRLIPMHRDILNMSDKKMWVDHINGDGLDNQKGNLRIATPDQNAKNRKVSVRSKTGFKGVRLTPNRKKPCAVAINSNGKDYFGGYFDNAIDAARKFNELSIKHHGEFAYLNKI